jgi:15-cis-phytoene synthase
MTERDAQVCQRIVRTHARTFHLASVFLAGEKRRAAFALYAFCRVADDIVDRAERAADGSGMADPAVAQALGAHRARLAGMLAGRPEGPVFRELQWVVQRFGVPASVLEELLDGVAMDLEPVHYETWDDLSRYCEGVASSVGEMCTYVFGVQGDSADRTTALRHARTLGVAMQLTNILRDVGEDARRHRCYLPVDELTAHGLSADGILRGAVRSDDARWQSFMAGQLRRARALYDQAAAGIPLLQPDAQRCAWACAIGYAAILGAIEAIACNSLEHRARLGTWQRLRVLWRVWRMRPVIRPDRSTGSAPASEWSSPARATADEFVQVA